MARSKIDAGALNIHPSPALAGTQKEAGPAVQPIPAENGTVAITAPQGHAPATPAGFVPPSVTVTRTLRHPQLGQVHGAEATAAELAALPPERDWQVGLGVALPAPGEVAASLRVATAWSDEAKAAKAWARYTQARSNAAWDHALGQVAQVEPMVAALAATSPELSRSLTATQGFLGVRKVAGQRGAATRTSATRAEKLAATAAARAARTQHAADAAKLAESARAAARNPAPAPAQQPATPPGPATRP